MASNFDDCSSINSSSAQLSVRNQTKEKFESLLKAAVRKKRPTEVNQSREQLLESPSGSAENLSNDKKSGKKLRKESENYILNKFLDDSSDHCHTYEIASEGSQNSSQIKAPIPKPRTKKPASTTSQRTFEVTSPKIVKNDNGSQVSNATFNVEEIGDVLVHKSPLKAKIIVKENVKARLSDKSESNDESSESEINENTKKKKLIKIESEEQKVKKSYTYDKIVEVTILKTDRLQLSSLVVHPIIKLHVIDAMTGKYFPKSDKSRSVVFFYENSDNDYISPVMTRAYNLQEKRILYPLWEESILLNEDFEYFKDESNRIILFFELLDFVSVSTLHQLNQKECVKGWHNIAFAFLKLAGKNGELNIGKNLRLQLYHSHQTKKNDPQVCNAWVWWKKKKLKKYPSTLHIAIKSVVSPTKVVETFRSKTPIQRETSSRTKLCDEIQNNQILNPEGAIVSVENKSDEKNKETLLTWSRKRNEVCKFPNKCLVKFNSLEQGCFVMKFSPSGKYLACAVQNEDLFYVIVYSIVSLNEVNRFPSHQAIIYCLRWFSDDVLLLSASADNTVCIHNLSDSSFQILPHPSFVYCCDISKDKVIVTGCYDGIIRIWNQTPSDKKSEFHLYQELEAHKAYITSLCWNKKSSIFSADSTGAIIEWQKKDNDWVLKREINLLDLKETVINQILLFPNEKRLLVHSRDNIIRIIDLKSGCVLHWLRGASNKRFQLFCSISPCGTYVNSGSENGFVHVWNAKNGHEVAVYLPYASDHQFLTIHCVDFHPYDNMVAISHYGRNLPVLIFCFDKNIEKPEVELTFKENVEVEYVKNQQSSKELRLNGSIKRERCSNKNEEKIDFKAILHKMDVVLTLQKN
ncbi:jouberin [Tribolium castaneum]|uniref:Jouberin-like Protein n=1 Tax=Tribolium castaneum TaxID=7070 RepID=D6WGR1_TRICA|nr:PREDICTED: jouberin [Tribolium castaneum]EEZ99617.1 Jouberin-like Protein [Tribolium castaneum]|eukprot:XP_008194128.1 PREDICTED: jouberin [Tribolium castaneum]